MLRPSGVSSASEASCAASARSSSVTSGAGRNAVAWRLPSVIVPVLSRRRTSTSPAASTARPDVAMTFAWIMRSMPAMPIADKQAADGGRNQADEQRDEHGDRHGLPGARGLHAEEREGQERDRREEEDDGERREQDVERDLVRRLLALRALDHRDHAIEEGLAGIGGDADDEPVGEHARAGDDGAPIAAALADDRRALAGDRASLTDATPSTNLAVAGDVVAGLDEDDVALAKRRPTRRRCVTLPSLRLGELLRGRVLARCAERVGLRLAATLGHRFGEVREQDREPEPERDGEDEARPAPRPSRRAPGRRAAS